MRAWEASGFTVRAGTLSTSRDRTFGRLRPGPARLSFFRWTKPGAKRLEWIRSLWICASVALASVEGRPPLAVRAAMLLRRFLRSSSILRQIHRVSSILSV